ncbi:MAG: TrpR-like protein, YerC/YecD [Ruminococcaceae bacterium]|nr:TrpR-like protein, YerC/YecD [Oscillospiraceae bacterium]
MENKLKDNNIDFLFSSILKLETLEECYKFFGDICTVPEIRTFAQRVVVAHMLNDGWVYSDIVARTGASTATISRVRRSLLDGRGGYDVVFERMSDEERSLLPTKTEDKE